MDEHRVELAIWSSSLSANAIVEAAGVVPDESWNSGDTGPGGRPLPGSGVSYRSGLPATANATEQVSAVLARVAARAENIGALASDDTEVTLSIGYFINEAQWQQHGEGELVRGLGVSLTSAHIELLHALSADFDVDIYCPE